MTHAPPQFIKLDSIDGTPIYVDPRTITLVHKPSEVTLVYAGYNLLMVAHQPWVVMRRIRRALEAPKHAPSTKSTGEN